MKGIYQSFNPFSQVYVFNGYKKDLDLLLLINGF